MIRDIFEAASIAAFLAAVFLWWGIISMVIR